MPKKPSNKSPKRKKNAPRELVRASELARRMRFTRASISVALKSGRIEHEPGTELFDFEKSRKSLLNIREKAKIKKRLTGTEWARKYRVLAEDSPNGAKWNPNLTPYVTEILDRMTDPKERCRVFVVQKGSQLGASTIAENLIGCVIHQDPVPMIMTQETATKMKATTRRSIQPMLDCQVFEGLVSPPGAGARSGYPNNYDEIGYPGGSLSMSGSNSSASYSSKPAPIIILDEYARYPKDVKKEGDVLTLATGRIRTYGNKARIYVPSTPVDDAEDTGSMTALHLLGDQREFFVPCPHCGDMDYLRPERFGYQLKPRLKAWMTCTACGADGTKRQYAPGFKKGEWRPTSESGMSTLTSYRLPAFVAPLKWGSWEDIAEKWDQAKQGNISMQGVQNLEFGRPYTPVVIDVNEKMLERHMVDFEEGVVPIGACVVTIAIDCQQEYLQWEAKAWGPEMKSWSFAEGEIAGKVKDAHVFDQVRELVYRMWPTAAGGAVQASLSVIDSGAFTEDVYAICEKFPQPLKFQRSINVPASGSLIPSKGYNAYDPERLVMNARPAKIGQQRYGVHVWMLGGPIAKLQLFQALARNPEDVQASSVRYPKTRPMSWMKQLIAEAPERATTSTGKSIVKWVKKANEMNEALDLHVMHCAAAYTILDLTSWSADRWKRAERATMPIMRDDTTEGPKEMVRPQQRDKTMVLGNGSKMVRPRDRG